MELEKQLIESIASKMFSFKNIEDTATLVVGGGWLQHGPPYLAAISALKANVGRVYLAAPKTLSTVYRSMSPDIIVLPLPDMKFTKGCARKLIKWMPKVKSIILGPGLGKGCREGLEVFIKETKNIPLILVDEALHYDIIRMLNNRMHILLVTAKEFQHLFDIILPENFKEREKIVESKAREANVTVFLKDSNDIISDGESTIVYNLKNMQDFVHRSLNVTAGLIAAYIVKGLTTFEAAALASYVSGRICSLVFERKGPYFVPSELIEYIQPVHLEFNI
jgi:NAD(P)H-hydrate epimerase